MLLAELTMQFLKFRVLTLALRRQLCRQKPKKQFVTNTKYCSTNTATYASFIFLPSLIVIKNASCQDKKTFSKKLIKEADELYNNTDFEKLYDLLKPHAISEDPEVLWRLARATYEKCRDIQQDKERLGYLEEALGLVDRALSISDECWAAHKWRAILLDYVWQLKSTKGRIIHSFDIKKHTLRAIELNPKDSTSYYLLGEWCYTFADMPWYQRKVAAAIFASPPTSTYEEALHYFKTAEEITPQFYSMNLLMLGKCYTKLGDVEKAEHFLKQAKTYTIKTADDKKAKEEAEKLLSTLKGT